MKRKISDISVIKENNILNLLYCFSDDVYDKYYNLSKISNKSKDTDIIDISNYIPYIHDQPYAIRLLEYNCRPRINYDIFGRNANSARNMFQKCRDDVDNE